MVKRKRALICGVSGQDGAYLAKLLLEKGYEVYGTSRDAQLSTFINLHRLGIYDDVEFYSTALTDFRSVLQVLSHVEPDELYNLAGQSSVGLSFQQPVEALESISLGTLNLLESIRFLGITTRIYNASSSECFGDTAGVPANESTPFRPRSPYAVAKAAAFWQVANYREAYSINACSGILFNHESPLRPERFVTQKIVRAVVRIADGSDERLKLGRLDVQRDWGWAPEYVQAMWKMLQRDQLEDFIVATGKTHSLKDFVETAFSVVGLDWERYVDIDNALMRPTDIDRSSADPSLAKEKLGWNASITMEEVVKLMVHAEQERNSI